MNSRVRAYLELVRLPNVFTALADVLMGAWFVSKSSIDSPLPPLHVEVLLLLLAASACLYMAGMVLNDVCDREQDAWERPARPIPSGRVSLKAATVVGTELLLFGVAFAWLASYMSESWRPGAVATGLALLVLAYDAVLKRTWFGAIAMGGCRTLNVLLGMTVAGSAFAWQGVNFHVAVAMGAFIAGVTWFARTEAVRSGRLRLAVSTAIMIGSLFALSIFPRFVQLPLKTILPPGDLMFWYISWGTLAALIGMLAMAACMRPVPVRVQAAVRISILSLIPINAAICFLMQGTLPALGILVLLIPAMHLGRWIYST